MEQWRPVIGWEGLYEVSDHGRVRSLARTVAFGTRTRVVPPTVLKHGKTTQGKPQVHLSGNGRKKVREVHILVLEAFVGQCPQGLEACHENDVADDNRLENLRWDTHSANESDKVRNGGHYQASKTHCPRKHEYTPENTKVGKRGGRWCRQCHREDARARYHRDIETQRTYRREQKRRQRADLVVQEGG